jgi:hypothetical protein
MVSVTSVTNVLQKCGSQPKMGRIVPKSINTESHYLIGVVWPFRGCEVEMHRDGFSCTCKKRMTYKCNHIKSVELGILGVGQKQYELIHY